MIYWVVGWALTKYPHVSLNVSFLQQTGRCFSFNASQEININVYAEFGVVTLMPCRSSDVATTSLAKVKQFAGLGIAKDVDIVRTSSQQAIAMNRLAHSA
jgi:hypothetical protein